MPQLESVPQPSADPGFDDQASAGEAPPEEFHRRRARRWPASRSVALAVGVVLALLVYVLATRPSAVDVQAKSPLLGHPAPPVDAPSVTPAAFSSLAALRGRWVVVNFFATWCVPCQQEQPEFVQFRQRHQQEGDVAVVMVIYNDDVGKVRSFLGAKGGDWPAVPDPGGAIAISYGVTGPPETYLVDPNGFVVSKVVGGITADGLDRLLTEAKQAGA